MPVRTLTSTPSGQARPCKVRSIARAASSAAGARSKTAKNSSARASTSRPPTRCTNLRMMARTSAKRAAYRSPSRWRRLVDPSISVKRNVTYPVGSVRTSLARASTWPRSRSFSTASLTAAVTVFTRSGLSRTARSCTRAVIGWPWRSRRVTTRLSGRVILERHLVEGRQCISVVWLVVDRQSPSSLGVHVREGALRQLRPFLRVELAHGCPVRPGPPASPSGRTQITDDTPPGSTAPRATRTRGGPVGRRQGAPESALYCDPVVRRLGRGRMGHGHPLDRYIGDAYPDLEDPRAVAAFERIPYDERIAVQSTYEALRVGASLAPDEPAIHFLLRGEPEEEPLTLTYRQYLGRVSQTANLLHDMGVGARDVVSFMLPLLPQSYMVLFGAEAAGIVNPVNPMLEVGQIAEILKAAGTKVLVTLGPMPGTEIWDKSQHVRKLVPSLERVLQVLGPGDERDGVYSFDALVDRYPAEGLTSKRQIEGRELAAYFHTGGTTGLPKLVRHTHKNQVSQAWGVTLMFQAEPQSAILCGLPLFHVGGALTQGLAPLSSGQRLVILTPTGYRNPAVIRNYWRLVERYRAAVVGAVPTVLAAVLNAPHDGVDLSSVRYASGGGSAIPVEVGKAIEAITGTRVLEVYGMTETSSVHTMSCAWREVRLGSVGHPLPYAKVRVVKLDGEGRYERDCAVDEIGVVAMSGPGVFAGYMSDQHNRDAWVEEGWVNSGDLGRLDGDGYLWITGRSEEHTSELQSHHDL